MKIRNTKTGEVIDLSAPKEKPKSEEAKTEDRIKERGTIQDTAKKLVGKESVVEKVIAGAQVADAPFSAIESAISNPALAIQKGDVKSSGAMAGPMGMASDPKGSARDMGKVIQEAILGISLQKQGQYGDIMKNAGFNPILADTAGVVLHLSPVKVYSEVAKTFGAISKMSDKGMLKAGDNLLNAVNQAKNAVGVKVTQEFAKGADNVPVDGIAFIDDIAKLPAPIMKRAETVFGDLAEFANGLTVGKVREFKRFLGKLKPSSYGQAERGIQENLDVQDLQKVYSNLKSRITGTLSDPKSGIPKKQVEYLAKLEESYSDVVDASRYIRKAIVDPVLETPSKVGNLAKKVSAEGDATSRIALTTIKKASSQAMRNVNEAMKQIENFNRNQQLKSVAGHAINAAVYGGVAGGVGGRILRSIQGSD